MSSPILGEISNAEAIYVEHWKDYSCYYELLKKDIAYQNKPIMAKQEDRF